MNLGEFWTPERINKAAKLWAEGKSYTQIALAMSDSKNTITRNSISGLCNRNREVFPLRRPPQPRRQKAPIPAQEEEPMTVVQFPVQETRHPVASHGYTQAPKRTIEPKIRPKLTVYDSSIKPRRFEDGFSAGYDGLQYYLLCRGYELVRKVNKFRVTHIETAKIMFWGDWSRVVDFTDTFRAAEGKQTIKARSA